MSSVCYWRWIAAVWLALLWIGGPDAHAQERAALNGYVEDATSGETLIGANVLVEEAERGASTNTSGYYTLPRLPPGTYTVRFSYVGYRTQRLEVTLEAGEERRLDVALVPDDVTIEEVVVTAEEQEAEAARDLGISQLPARLVRELPSVLEPDVFRSLQLLPGIAQASDFSSGLYIRGGSPDQTLILLDRTTVYNPSHFFGFFSTFNPDAIKDVRVYKGAFPASYGGRLGSVVDIYNKDGNRRSTRGSASVGLLASRAFLEGPLPDEQGSYMVAVRRSTLEPLLAVLQDADIDGIPDSFYFFDINAKLNWDANQRNRFSLSVYTGQDNLLLPFLDDAVFDIVYGNQTLSLNWTHLFSNRLFSNFTFTGSRYFSEPVAILSGTEIEQENTVVDVSAKGDLEFDASDAHRLEAGFWTGLLSFSIANAFQGDETFEESTNTAYVEGYVQDRWRLTDRLELNLGLRANYFAEGDYFRLGPRASAEYRLTDAIRLQAGAGRYHQFLTLETNEAISAFDQWLTTGAGVPPSSGNQFVLGAKTQLSSSLRFDVEGYYRSMDDLFQLNPLLPDRAGLDYADAFVFGDGYALGAEFFLERTEGAVTGFAAYTLGQTRRRFDEINDGRRFAPRYDRTHDLNVVANYDLTTNWRLTGVFAYATGQAYTPAVGQYRLSNDPVRGAGTNVVQSRFNAARLPAYHRLDVGLTRRGRFFGFADYELQFQVINAYGRSNTWFFFFDFEDDGSVTQNDIPQIPIPLPNIAFTLQF